MRRHSESFFGHHRGHRFGRFGKAFMEGGMGARNFPMGRKLQSSDLQLLILKLLAEKPRHGYEIIKQLDQRSKGFYVPSPGMVYPALNFLEEINLATVAVEGTRKLYSITDLGKTHLTENMTPADALLEQLGRVGDRMARVRAMLDVEAGEQGLGVSARGGRTELKRALHELHSTLESKWSAPADEQQRIAAILQHAAAQIEGADRD